MQIKGGSEAFRYICENQNFMLKLLSIVGARPQFIKAAAISRSIRDSFSDKLQEVLVHSGQHYDANMSSVFFDELELSLPNYTFNLTEIGSSKQIAEIIIKLDSILLDENPDAVLVYGDTNTTLAGAFSASKHQIPLIHIEAGLRSFNKNMPEELNRVLTDHCSSILFCPTKTAIKNLRLEGIIHSKNSCSPDHPKVYYCGDIMYDNSVYYSKDINKDILSKNGLDNYLLFTMHRPINTDNPFRLRKICKMIVNLAEKHQQKIVFPIHPRTKNAISNHMIKDDVDRFMNHQFIKVIEPVSYKEMIVLEKNCDMIITDSGGVQKEAYFFEKPSIVLRSETEWLEIINQGASVIVNADEEKLNHHYNLFKSKRISYPKLFGDGRSASFICNKIIEEIQ